MLVQFGNNWIKKIPRTAKLDEFFSSNYCQIGQACSPITYTNTNMVFCSTVKGSVPLRFEVVLFVLHQMFPSYFFQETTAVKFTNKETGLFYRCSLHCYKPSL